MPGPQPLLHQPYAQWSADDQLLWQRAMGADDPFATGAHLAKASKHDYLFAWRRFLGFLAIHEPEALELPPADRLNADRIRAFRAHLAETNIPRSVAVIVDAVYKAARLMMPEQDWTWLKAIKARLYRHAPSGRPTGPPITSVQLWDFGEQLMQESKPRPDTPIRMTDAVQYRDGLLIALAAFIPIRRRNILLEIGRHLVRDGDGWLVLVPAEESKTGISMSYLVPEFLEPYLALYLDVVRPTLLRHSTAALWVSSKGGGICYGAIGQIVTKRLTSRFGFRVTLHDVRDAAVTTWAIFAPDQIGVAGSLLGHSDQRTADKHYNRARGIEASRAHAQLIAGMRRKRTRRSR